MPFKIWAIGEEVLAADMQTHFEEQIIATFPSTAARDAAIIAPKDGQRSYITTTKAEYLWNGTAWESAPTTPKLYSAVANGAVATGPTEVTLATVNVPAQLRAVALVAAAFMSARNTIASDEFTTRIRVAGTEQAATITRMGGINSKTPFIVPTCTPYALPANTPAAVTFTCQRTTGTGGLVEDMKGVLTVTAYPT